MTIIVFNSCGKNDDPKKEEISLTTDAGVMINGVKWATRNVDRPGTFTAKPEDPGMLYQWNSKVGWEYNKPLTPATWDDNWNGNNATAWEKINDPCPPGWRMPSQGELNSLISFGSVWKAVDDRNGRQFGSGSNTLFLPAAGLLSVDGTPNSLGSYGYYWSNTLHDSISSYRLNFGNVRTVLDYRILGAGFSCRCVAE